MLLLAQNNQLPPPQITYTVSAFVTAQLILVGIIGVLIFLVIRNNELSLTQARRNERRFRELVYNSPDAIFVLNLAEDKIVLANRDTFCGYNQQELEAGLTQKDPTIHPDDRSMVKSHWGRLYNQSTPEDDESYLEYRMKAKSGAWRWFQSRARVLSRTPGGQPVEVLLTLTDITAQKKSQATQAQYARRLEVLHRIDQAILAQGSIADIATVVISHLQTLIVCQRISILLFDVASQTGTVLASYSQQPSKIGAGDRLTFSELFHTSEPLTPQSLHRIVEERFSNKAQPLSLKTLLAEGIRYRFGLPIKVKDELIGMLSFGKSEAEPFDQNALDIAREVVAQLAIAIHQTRMNEQIQSHAAGLEIRVQERTQELEQLYRRQAALASITLTISQPSELQALLEQIANITRDTLPASAASIILWNSEANKFEISASTLKNQPKTYTAQQARRQGGATRWIVENRQPMIVSDIQDDPFQANPMLKAFGLKAYAGIPLISGNTVVGVLYALDREIRHYTTEDIRFLQELASRAVTAIDKVNLYQQAKTIATLEERQRLSRELHDSVSQALFSSSVIAESTLRICETDPPTAKHNLETLHRLNRGGLAEMRLLLLELRPDSFAEADLEPLLQKLLESVVGRTELAVYCHIDPHPALSLDVKTALYRIVQESLNNIVKHAQARQISLVLHQLNLNELDDSAQPQQLLLEIRDDGLGFDSEQNQTAQHGLTIMHERAESIQAQLEIVSALGQGTTVRVTWPKTTIIEGSNGR